MFAKRNLLIDVISGALRVLPSFKGKTRLIRLINRALLMVGINPVIECQFLDQTRFVVDLRSRTEAVPCYLGNYDQKTQKFATSLVKEGSVVLDVGANIGFFAVPLARVVGESGKLFCFEPLPSNFSRLKENLKLNGYETRATCSQIALSDSTGDLKLGLYGDFKSGGSTGNAVPMAAGQPTPFSEIVVPRMMLDAWVKEQNLSKIDFIKIDIEGHEDCFFRGATHSIDTFRPIILGEFSEGHMGYKGVDVDHFFSHFFVPRNYIPFLVREGKITPVKSLKGRMNDEDILLLPQEKKFDL